MRTARVAHHLGMVIMAQEFYSPVDVEKLLGISRPAVRTYANRYGRWLSTEATPEPGRARRFRAGDLRVLAFIYAKTTAENQDHDQVMAVLEENQGVPPAFTWQLDEAADQPSPDEAAADNPSDTALVLRTAQVLLMDSREREAAGADQLERMQSEIARLSLELGEARGALSVYQARKRPKWWKWLFGE